MTGKKKRDLRALLLLAIFMTLVFCVNSALAGKGVSEEEKLKQQQAQNILIQQAINARKNSNNP